MNKENLQRMADYIRTIPQERFDMGLFRYGDESTIECDSVGDVIGHCVHLAPELITRDENGDINFSNWSVKFTGLKVRDWYWCFFSEWQSVDNTPAGAAARIEWLIKNGRPRNWEQQVGGYVPLCYKTESPK